MLEKDHAEMKYPPIEKICMEKIQNIIRKDNFCEYETPAFDNLKVFWLCCCNPCSLYESKVPTVDWSIICELFWTRICDFTFVIDIKKNIKKVQCLSMKKNVKGQLLKESLKYFRF